MTVNDALSGFPHAASRATLAVCLMRRVDVSRSTAVSGQQVPLI
jgi:hypothetical protein